MGSHVQPRSYVSLVRLHSSSKSLRSTSLASSSSIVSASTESVATPGRSMGLSPADEGGDPRVPRRGRGRRR